MYVTETDQNMVKLALNKSLLKEYETSEGRTVYLNDGDEFQLQLFNPTSSEIGAEIFINNESLSNMLVIRPGERIWLERYLDKAKKFKFSTYTVDDTVETERAIKNNGTIMVKFYNKKRKDAYNYISTSAATYKLAPEERCTTIKGIDTSMLNINANCATLTASADTKLFAATNCTNDSLLTCFNSTSSNPEVLGLNTAATIETGRVAEGSHSSQQLYDVDIEFDYFAFKTENLHILPMSRKPYTSNDLDKIYCSECGRKLKTKYKFCPFCGTKIDY